MPGTVYINQSVYEYLYCCLTSGYFIQMCICIHYAYLYLYVSICLGWYILHVYNVHTYIHSNMHLSHSRSAFHRRLPPRQCIEIYICHVHVVNCLLLYICIVCDAFHVIHISINYSNRAHDLSLSNCMHVHNQ